MYYLKLLCVWQKQAIRIRKFPNSRLSAELEEDVSNNITNKTAEKPRKIPIICFILAGRCKKISVIKKTTIGLVEVRRLASVPVV